ncbi:MAG: aminopeptidase [Euryarchaeota archaeon]|jgi:leucyl aminopeptidase (aminopeptidase T)|nr:aminopeptidase [Euryarchaeota archaeon]MBT6527565.1 aminopeptidase [Euryarchaeota archaeon]MBT7961968.1 aminopeptidase [Euryarchaeota archaeon]
MVRPFSRKGKKTAPAPVDDDELEEVINEVEEAIDESTEAQVPQVTEVLEEQIPFDELSIEEVSEGLKISAQTVIKTCMDIRRGENVLIVCDPTTGDIGQALHEAANERSDRVLLIVMPKARHHGEEPPSPVANLMRQQQVVIAPTRYSLTHTRAIRQSVRDGARVATMPGMTNEMFSRGGMSADFNEIKQKISDLTPYFRRRRIVHVKSEQGTDVTFEVNWREWKLDDNGICNRPKMLTNLPAGKAFIMPREGTMNGKVVIDGSWESNLVDEPITLVIEEGMVMDVKGGTTAAAIRQEFGEAAKRLRTKDRENVWTVAEFGFGMNPQARLSGNVLEDEKRLGTCYFSVGDNTALGGTSAVGIHIPGVLKNASVWLDDTQLITSGEFTLWD